MNRWKKTTLTIPTITEVNQGQVDVGTSQLLCDNVDVHWLIPASSTDRNNTSNRVLLAFFPLNQSINLLGNVIHTYIHRFNGRLSGTTRVSRYQKGN